MVIEQKRYIYRFREAKEKRMYESLLYFSEKDVKRVYLEYLKKKSICSDEYSMTIQLLYNIQTVEQQLKMETNYSEFLYCPHCHTSHRTIEFFVPNNGRSLEDIIEKHKDKLIESALTIFDSYHNSEYDIYEILLMSIFDETKSADDRPSHYKYRKVLDNGLDIPASEFETDEKGIIFRCPNCKKQLKSKTQRHIFSSYMFDDFAGMVLTRANSWKYENSMLFAYHIITKEDSPIVSLSLNNVHIYPNPYGKMHVIKSNERISFNTQTGQAYIFRPVDVVTHKPFNGAGDTRIKNITYQIYPILHSKKIPEYVYEELVCEILKKKGMSMTSKEISHLLSSTSFSKLFITCEINRFADVYDKNFLEDCLCLLKSYCPMKYIKKMYKYSKTPKLFATQYKKEAIKSKKIRKICFKNPHMILVWKVLSTIGFRNVDVIEKMMMSDNRAFLNTIINHYYDFDKKTIKEEPFIVDYISAKSELELYKKMVSCDSENIIVDVFRIYKKLCKMIILNDEAKKKLFSGTFIEIHENLSMLYDQLNTTNHYINYYDEDMCLNGAIGEYYFELAKTSFDMKQVGTKMRICVGSYHSRAFLRQCFIVFMKNRYGELQACIELSDDKKKLKQAKDYCNGLLEPQKKSALVKWLQVNNIEYLNCFDSKKNQLEEIAPSEDIFDKDSSFNGYNIVKTIEEMKQIEYINTVDINSFGTLIDKPTNDAFQDIDYVFFD